MKSQGDSQTSRRTSASSDGINDSGNLINVIIKRYFDSQSYAKFQQVLEYLGEDLYVPLYTHYNANLMGQLALSSEYAFPEGLALSYHTNLKLKFYAFRFIANIGNFIVDKVKGGDEKAEAVFVILIKILLFHALTSKSDTASLALVELEQLCHRKGMNLSALFISYRSKILRLVIKAVLHKVISDSERSRASNGDEEMRDDSSSWSPKKQTVIPYLKRAIDVFNIAALTRDDVAQTLTILINFAHKELYNEAIKTFLQHLAASQGMEVAPLLRMHIQAIIVSLLLRNKFSHLDLTASLNKVCSFGQTNIKDLLATKFTSIKSCLLLNYSMNQKLVKDGTYFLSKFEKEELEQPFEDEFDDEHVFIGYLNPSMIGILLGVDDYFTTHKDYLGSKESIKHIESLVKIIALLTEQQVRVIHVKLLSTLSLLLRLRPNRDKQELNIAIKEICAIFVTKLSSDLRVSLLINLSVAMYDLVEDCPEEIAPVYRELILTKSTSPMLNEQLKSLFFIPDIPPFNDIYSHLTPYVKRENCVNNLNDLQASLDCVFPLLKLENNKCRSIALTKMRKLLKSNQKLLISDMLVNLDEPLDQLISKTIESLLALSSTKHDECLALVAECLGILGAVNPVRLDHLIYGDITINQSTSVPDIKSADFIVSLIERLKMSLLSDERSESETANYALQVVVKTFTVFENPSIKIKLSPDALKACGLCQNTSYSTVKKLQADLSMPVYEKSKCEYQYSYKDWLDKFFCNLVSVLKDKKAQEVLHACSCILRYNQKLADYLIPNTVMYILINQPSHSDLVSKEIMAILDEDVGVSTQDLDTVYSRDMRSNIQTLHFQCANMVFCILDSIKKLDADIRAPSSPLSGALRHANSLRKFSDSIPKDKLAILASKCRSHARALCYFEQYLALKTSEVDKYATSLQRIYMALDDPYEAAGVEMVRTSPTNIIDDIANYEACGRFDKASICYSTTLEDMDSDTDRETFIEDALKCLSNQGDNHRLYEKSRQMMIEYPQFKRSVLPAAVEASSKLGRWDELENLFSKEPLSTMFESTSVGLGYLLTSFLQSRQDAPARLDSVRLHLIKPLSIAMMDRSAYFRGYQNLLVLHNIEDFALSLDALEKDKFNTQHIDENTVDVLRPKLLNSLAGLLDTWTKRNKLVQPSLRSLEPLMDWQRTISLVISKKYPFLKTTLDIEIGKMWLNSADIARESRSFDRSFLCLTQARRRFGTEFHKLNFDLQVRFYMEQAKLDWDQGERTRAIRSLKLSFERLKSHPLSAHLSERRNQRRIYQKEDPFPHLNDLISCPDCDVVAQHDRVSFAQLKMLLTQFSEEAADGIPETLFFMYEECVHLGVNQEETYFRLARYYDRLLTYYMDNPRLCGDRVDEKHNENATQQFSQNLMSGDREDVYTKLMEHSVIAFGNSLKYGATYLNESMPRMLNIWFDLGSKKSKPANSATPRAVSSRIENTVRFMDELKKCLPPYYFMAAISLILSRVCHPHSGISKKTQEILELLLTSYPHQISWMIIALLNDRDNVERKRAATIVLSSLRRKTFEVEKIIQDTIAFSNVLKDIAIAYGPFDRSRDESRRKKFQGGANLKDLSTAAARFNFKEARVIPPVQATMRAILPTGGNLTILRKHIVYPDCNRFFIRCIQPRVKIYNSLQQPRGIVVECDNGKSVQLLCKAGDDLRKDSRCIEFFNLLNRILRRNSQSNARFFEIPTFLVLPLESNCGVIEMLPNCETFRSIIDHIYKERNPKFTVHEYFPRKAKEISPTDIHAGFKKVINSKDLKPEVLPIWFLRKFTEPTSWYIAKLAYSRSTAVISMGGYIIGLGDRHLDNILFDTCNGRVAHVDFNLLFHQGESLPTPEVVPFRLTHNMVAALGPMGTEGNFRKVCEITMRVMRKEKDALLTTLKPFMHDPCSEWVKVRDTSSRANRVEQEDKHADNRTAKSKIEVIERKLKGFPRSKKYKPLTLYDSYSVEAQVDNLIEEATDTHNLSQMYYGWCPQI